MSNHNSKGACTEAPTTKLSRKRGEECAPPNDTSLIDLTYAIRVLGAFDACVRVLAFDARISFCLAPTIHLGQGIIF
jgi:hypothetical protein